MNKMGKVDNVVIENARILFRNFSGREQIYNEEGDRNFCVVIDDEKMANDLAADGWNVRILKPKDEYSEPTHYIPVKVSYKILPPEIHMITKKNDILLDESTVSRLDYAEIKNVDLTLRPRRWGIGDQVKIKAYLKNMFVTLEEDRLAEKYASLEHPVEDDEEALPFN